ncbi:MAG TPA: hypothetical protein VJ898_10860 [Natrialbaceae archaeon]|nr:hypothetical protein [Natrialbaceae archaeon]
MPRSEDPAVIRSIAVTIDDVLTAFEANRQRDVTVVLRITPPFSGRMRARIHAGATEYDEQPTPIHVRPGDLIDEDSAGPYPTPDRTEDELRADPDESYSPERHHDYHAERVDAWRDRARDAIVDTVRIDTPGGSHEVRVKTLGSTGEPGAADED